MKLSVVIPVYNGADFILKSYNSIINQDIEDVEILYVDNNSTDNSIENIQSLQKKDSRVSLHFQKKQGAAPTRNMGIKAANGEYIYVFDVDDEIYPNALKSMLEVLENRPNLDAVFGKMVKSDKGISETIKPNDETYEVIIKEKPHWGLFWFASLKEVVGPPAFLYRATVFEKIGLYNESLRIGQDTALDIKLGMSCNIAFLDRYVYLYFKHETSTIQKAKKMTPRAFLMWPRLINEHLPFYLDNEVPLKFKQLLFSQLYQTLGKQLFFTKRFKNRNLLKNKLLSEIGVIQIPFLLKSYLSLIVVMPISIVIKFYGYYLVPYLVKKIK